MRNYRFSNAFWLYQLRVSSAQFLSNSSLNSKILILDTLYYVLWMYNLKENVRYTQWEEFVTILQIVMAQKPRGPNFPPLLRNLVPQKVSRLFFFFFLRQKGSIKKVFFQHAILSLEKLILSWWVIGLWNWVLLLLLSPLRGMHFSQ